MKNHYSKTAEPTRIFSFLITLILMFSLSATTASGKKIAYAYLDVAFGQLNFDYADESKVKSYENNNNYRVWKDKEITESQGSPGWLSYANMISTVTFTTNFKEVKPYYLDHWFDGLNQLTSFWGMENLNTSETRLMECMFKDCTSLTQLDLSTFNTSKVTSFTEMFRGCTALTKLNISSFDTSNAIYMNAMFAKCEKLTSLSLTNFNTQNVTSFREMFRECKSLTYVNLSSFRTMKVKYMRYMFDECSSLKSIDLSNFNTSNV